MAPPTPQRGEGVPSPAGRRPNWQMYHDLGAALMRGLPGHCSYDEIAAEFGMSKQMAYHETATALGKLAYRLRRQIADWREA